MPIYIVVPLRPEGDSQALNQSIANTIKETSRYRLQAERGWLIEYEGTTVELCEAIGLGRDEKHRVPGSGIVIPVSGYFGRGPTDMWEWLKTRIEK